MAQMSYEKDGGTCYPVQPGDIWQAGPHQVLCADLETGAGSRFLARYPSIDLVLTDPPWNAAMARQYRQKAGLADRPVDFPGLLSIIASLIASTRAPLYMAIGNRQKPLAGAILERAGYVPQREFKITYYRTRPCSLLYATARDHALVPTGDLTGLDGSTWPGAVVGQATATVFDPCCGRGLMACAADGAGKALYGIELHPARVSVTMRKLADRGHKPKRIGRIADAG